MVVMPDRFQSWPGHTGNWGRWSNNRGALNLVDNDTVLRGVASVRSGTVVPCSRKLNEYDHIIPEPVFEHKMICAGRVPHWPERDVQNASDKLSAWIHGTANTHIDAFSHIGFHGVGFNGHPHQEMVSMESGAVSCDITPALAVVTRGLFVDAARQRGIPSIPPGDYVTLNEIRATADLAKPGDAFIVRLGLSAQCPETGKGSEADVHGTWAGLHPDCVDYLGDKGVALIGTDGPGDCYPSPLKGVCDSPVHVLSLVFWGIHLVHNMDLEALGKKCADSNQSSFLFSVAALHIEHGTGSLVTPVAVL
ncbi:MAG: cyclase family protein [Gammaproteobacteria bacterium]|nr:cyclase family protein [Gammaproteobacteria bacterium]